MQGTGLFFALGALGTFASLVSFILARFLRRQSIRARETLNPRLLVRFPTGDIDICLLDEDVEKKNISAHVKEIRDCVLRVLQKKAVNS